MKEQRRPNRDAIENKQLKSEIMQQGKPTSLKLFIVTAVIVALSILLATFRPGAGYVVIFAFIFILTVGLAGVGIYSGLTYRADEHKLRRHNRIGLIGNSLILLFMIGIMVYVLSLLK